MNDQDLLTLVMEGSPETFSGEELLALHQGVRRSAMVRRALQERLLLEECLVRALTVPPPLTLPSPANNAADQTGSAAAPTISAPNIPVASTQAASTVGEAAWPIWVKWGLGILFTTAGLSVPLLVVLLLGRGLKPDPTLHSLPALPTAQEPAEPEPAPVRGEAQDVGRVVKPLARDKHAAEIFSFDDEGSPSDQLPPSQR